MRLHRFDLVIIFVLLALVIVFLAFDLVLLDFLAFDIVFLVVDLVFLAFDLAPPLGLDSGFNMTAITSDLWRPYLKWSGINVGSNTFINSIKLILWGLVSVAVPFAVMM